MPRQDRALQLPSKIGRFALVGLGGFVVQAFVLERLTRLTALDYRLAAILAVEAAVLHNFVWHERWTWRLPKGAGSRMTRAVRFHTTTALVSIMGNVVLMSLFVEALGWPVLPANLAAVAILAIVNFRAADRWVFTASSEAVNGPDFCGRTSRRITSVPRTRRRRGGCVVGYRGTRLRGSSSRHPRSLEPLRGDDRAAYRCRTCRWTSLPRDGFRNRSTRKGAKPTAERTAADRAGRVRRGGGWEHRCSRGLDPPLAWIRVHSRRHARGIDVERERSDGTAVDSTRGRTGDTRLVTPRRWSASLSEAAAPEPRVRRLQHRARRSVPQALVRAREQS